MKKLIWTLLGASVAANVWLFFRPEAPAPTAAPAGAGASAASPSAAAKSSAVASVATGAASAKAPPASPEKIATVLKALAEFDENDLAGARDRLRALGADEETVFAAVDGVIRLNFYRLTRNTEIENIRNGWWHGDPASINKPAWGKEAESRFFALMGYDPHDIVDLGNRFDFLPREKAETLAKIAVDYYGMYLRVLEDPNPAPQAASLMLSERRNDIVKLLTPEELAEYDLRFSEGAAQNIRRFAKMQASEKEFRVISPIVERVQQEMAAMTRDTSIPADQRTTVQRDATQRAFDELVGAVGYDRAADYIWSGSTALVLDPATSTTVQFSPPSNAGRIMQLAAETGQQAAAIHNDASLSPEGKCAALLALQQATQPKLDQVLPPADRATVAPGTLVWYDSLARGEYMMLSPQLSGSTTVIYRPISVTTPARPAAVAAPQIRPVR